MEAGVITDLVTLAGSENACNQRDLMSRIRELAADAKRGLTDSVDSIAEISIAFDMCSDYNSIRAFVEYFRVAVGRSELFSDSVITLYHSVVRALADEGASGASALVLVTKLDSGLEKIPNLVFPILSGSSHMVASSLCRLVRSGGGEGSFHPDILRLLNRILSKQLVDCDQVLGDVCASCLKLLFESILSSHDIMVAGACIVYATLLRCRTSDPVLTELQKITVNLENLKQRDYAAMCAIGLRRAALSLFPEELVTEVVLHWSLKGLLDIVDSVSESSGLRILACEAIELLSVRMRNSGEDGQLFSLLLSTRFSDPITDFLIRHWYDDSVVIRGKVSKILVNMLKAGDSVRETVLQRVRGLPWDGREKFAILSLVLRKRFCNVVSDFSDIVGDSSPLRRLVDLCGRPDVYKSAASLLTTACKASSPDIEYIGDAIIYGINHDNDDIACRIQHHVLPELYQVEGQFDRILRDESSSWHIKICLCRAIITSGLPCRINIHLQKDDAFRALTCSDARIREWGLEVALLTSRFGISLGDATDLWLDSFDSWMFMDTSHERCAFIGKSARIIKRLMDGTDSRFATGTLDLCIRNLRHQDAAHHRRSLSLDIGWMVISYLSPTSDALTWGLLGRSVETFMLHLDSPFGDSRKTAFKICMSICQQQEDMGEFYCDVHEPCKVDRLLKSVSLKLLNSISQNTVADLLRCFSSRLRSSIGVFVQSMRPMNAQLCEFEFHLGCLIMDRGLGAGLPHMELIDLAIWAVDCVKAVLCTTAPEAQLLDGMDRQLLSLEGEEVSLHFCWRVAKSAIELIANCIELAEIRDSSNLEILLDRLSELCCQVRHVGIMRSLEVPLRSLCRQILQMSGTAALQDYVNHIIDRLEDISASESGARRSAGIPICIKVAVSAEHEINSLSRPVLALTIDRLLDIASRPITRLEPGRSDTDLGQVRALHCIRVLVDDSKLPEKTEFLFLLSLKGQKSTSWAIRNASNLLFSAVVKTSLDRSVSAARFLSSMPNLMEYAIAEVGTAVASRQGSLGLVCILCLLNELQPSHAFGELFEDLASACVDLSLSSHDFRVQRLAATFCGKSSAAIDFKSALRRKSSRDGFLQLGSSTTVHGFAVLFEAVPDLPIQLHSNDVSRMLDGTFHPIAASKFLSVWCSRDSSVSSLVSDIVHSKGGIAWFESQPHQMAGVLAHIWCNNDRSGILTSLLGKSPNIRRALINGLARSRKVIDIEPSELVHVAAIEADADVRAMIVNLFGRIHPDDESINLIVEIIEEESLDFARIKTMFDCIATVLKTGETTFPQRLITILEKYSHPALPEEVRRSVIPCVAGLWRNPAVSCRAKLYLAISNLLQDELPQIRRDTRTLLQLKSRSLSIRSHISEVICILFGDSIESLEQMMRLQARPVPIKEEHRNMVFAKEPDNTFRERFVEDDVLNATLRLLKEEGGICDTSEKQIVTCRYDEPEPDGNTEEKYSQIGQ